MIRLLPDALLCDGGFQRARAVTVENGRITGVASVMPEDEAVVGALPAVAVLTINVGAAPVIEI